MDEVQEIPLNVEVKLENDKEQATLEEQDPFYYTKRDAFTSEIYKIEIGNLPINFGYGQLRKLLNNKLQLNSHKIKGVSPRSSWAFVTFRCSEDQKRALATLDGYKWRGKELKVKEAAPVADPMVKKRKAEDDNDDDTNVKKPKTETEAEEKPLTITEQLKKAVSPLADLPYEDQLQRKEKNIRNFLVNFGRKIKKQFKDIPNWLQKQWDDGKLCCEVNPILPSPCTEGYRNKCEFTVGFGPDLERTVGFRLTRYAAGNMTVAGVDDCTIISERMKEVVKYFQEYVRSSSLEPYNPESYSGYWRQLTVRTNRKNDVMMIVVVHPQELTQGELETIKEDIIKYYTDGPGKEAQITSIYFQLLGNRISGEKPPLEYLTGEKYIYESLSGIKFRISPDAFFQVNTPATEILYNEIIKSVQQNPSATVVDICCGTGTIGISLSKFASKVIGIEMIQNAVSDAEYNAELNGIKNTTFICGKAEDVLYSALGLCSAFGLVKDEPLIAIVDPPRAGLHNKAIRTIRCCESIKQLIYVSCDKNAAMTNFIDLIRPISNQYKGPPFKLISATPVDLFPHTTHCELIMFFERTSADDLIIPIKKEDIETVKIKSEEDVNEDASLDE